MKILRSRIAVALLLGGLMSSTLSFSTTQISAQDTSSRSVVNPDAEVNALPAMLARQLLTGAIWGAAEELATKAIKYLASNNNRESGTVPANALD